MGKSIKLNYQLICAYHLVLNLKTYTVHEDGRPLSSCGTTEGTVSRTLRLEKHFDLCSRQFMTNN